MGCPQPAKKMAAASGNKTSEERSFTWIKKRGERVTRLELASLVSPPWVEVFFC